MGKTPTDEIDLRDVDDMAWLFNFTLDYLKGNLPAKPQSGEHITFVSLIASTLAWVMQLDDGADMPMSQVITLIRRDCAAVMGGESWIDDYNDKTYGPPQVSDLFGGEVVVVDPEDG